MKFIVVYYFLFFFDIYIYIFKTKVVKTARLWKSQYTTRWPLYKCCILRSILFQGAFFSQYDKRREQSFNERLTACSFHLHLRDKSRCGYWKRYTLQEHGCVQMYLPAYKQLPSDEKRKRIWKITCMQFSPSLAGQTSLWLLKKVYIARTWLCTNVPARLQTIA